MRRRPPPSIVDADRQILEHLDPYLHGAGSDEAAATLAFVAMERVPFEPDELAAAVRRALLVLAAGGDLRRELSLGDRAVTGLAEDIDRPGLRNDLAAALQELRQKADGLRGASTALDALIADPDGAWLALAAAVLADELTDDDA